jgi:hypothetical protein
MELIKTGFGISVGSILALLIFFALGIGIFIWGFIFVKREMKKPSAERHKGKLITGFVLMGLGMLLCLGFGAPIFFGLLGESL